MVKQARNGLQSIENFEKNLGRLYKKDKGKGIKDENGKDVLVARDS